MTIEYQIDADMFGPEFTGSCSDLVEKDFIGYLADQCDRPRSDFVIRQHVNQPVGAEEPSENEWNNAVAEFADDHPELFNVPVTLAVRLTAAVSGRSLIVYAGLTGSEDRVVGEHGRSNGTNELDRIEITIAGARHWVERRDLCETDGELIEWLPYDCSTTVPRFRD